MDFLRILSIHNGALILPFMNYPDILVLMRCSKRMYRIYVLYPQPFTFYGIPLPTQKGIWFDLFYQRYDSLENALQQKSDITVKFHHVNLVTRLPATSGPSTTSSILFHGMNLMEIAYMLRDNNAIALLQKYKRTTVHRLYSCSVVYGQHAHALVVAYNEHAVKEKLRLLNHLKRAESAEC